MCLYQSKAKIRFFNFVQKLRFFKNNHAVYNKIKSCNYIIFFFQFAALTVRYLTGRFIGEYRSNTDLLYNKTVILETGLTEVEIVDVYAGNADYGEQENEFPMEQVSKLKY